MTEVSQLGEIGCRHPQDWLPGVLFGVTMQSL